MHSTDIAELKKQQQRYYELKKQQQRYYALLNGAKRGLHAPKVVRKKIATGIL